MEGGNINKNMISQPLFGLSDTQQMMFAFGDSRRFKDVNEILGIEKWDP